METLIALSIKNSLEKKGYSVYKNIEEKEDGVIFVFFSGFNHYEVKIPKMFTLENAEICLTNFSDNRKASFYYAPWKFKDTEEIGEHLANLIDGFLGCKKIKVIHEKQ